MHLSRDPEFGRTETWPARRHSSIQDMFPAVVRMQASRPMVRACRGKVVKSSSAHSVPYYHAAARLARAYDGRSAAWPITLVEPFSCIGPALSHPAKRLRLFCMTVRCSTAATEASHRFLHE